MANLGIFAGGFSDTLNQGMQRNQQAQYQQQELKLQQQSQEQAQQRFEMSRNDKIAEETWAAIQNTVDQAREVGHTEKDVMPHIQGMLDAYRKFTTSIGYPGMADQKMAALWATPPKTQVEAAEAAAKDKPEVKTITGPSGEQTMYAVDARKGTAKEVAGTAQSGGDISGLEGNTLRDSLAKHAGITSDMLDVTASALNEGNTSVLTNLGRGKQGGEAVKAARAWAAYKLIHEEGLTPQEAAERVNANTAEYKATQAGATSLGRREAMVTGAITTAMQTAPRVIQASRAVSKTQYPTVNAIINAAQEGTGDENVIRLGISINTFVNNYARALGAGNAAVTNSARQEAFDNLNKAWSQGQIGAAIDQMLNKELPSELTGAKMGMREFLDSKKTGDRGGNTFGPRENITGISVQDAPPSGTSGKVRWSIEP